MTTVHRPQPGFGVTWTAVFRPTQRFVDMPVGSLELKLHGGHVEGAPHIVVTVMLKYCPLETRFSVVAINQGSLITINRPSTM